MRIPNHSPILGLACCLLGANLLAQQPAQPVQAPAKPDPAARKKAADAPLRTDKVTITAAKRRQDTFDSPRSVTTVDTRELLRESPLSIVDALNDKPGVWIEKRTITGSTPVMRGFSGANILGLIDGCSLTTMWGEGGFAGDDMWGKVDPESVARIEVVRGPTSALYGSNALGGVINFITRGCPLDYTKTGYDWGGRTKLGYGSVADYLLFRQEGWLATPDFKVFLGGTHYDADDTEGGRGVGTQTPTSGTALYFDFKASWRIDDSNELELSAQDVDRDKLYKYYKPNQQNFNRRQALTLTWLGQDVGGVLDDVEAKLYYQFKQDRRRDYGGSRTGVADWSTVSFDLKGYKRIDAHRFTGGVHYHEDHGHSPDDEQFTWHYWNGSASEAMAPNSHWRNIGVYLQDEWSLAKEWSLLGTVRYDHFGFESDVPGAYETYVANRQPGTYPAAYDPNVDDYTDDKNIFSGGLGVTWHVDEKVNLVASWTHGYRLFPPRFGLVSKGFGLLAPDSELKDEITSDTFELGAKVRTQDFSGSLFGWYSAISNWQTEVPGVWNGQTTIGGDTVYVTETGDAQLYGVEMESELRLRALRDLVGAEVAESLQNWILGVNFAWNEGTDKAAKKGTGGTEIPMRHTQPAQTVVTLRWEDPDKERNGWFEFKAELVGRYGAIPWSRWQTDYGYMRDPQAWANGGYASKAAVPKIRSNSYLPGFSVLTVRGGLDLCKDVSLIVGIENLTNSKYRRAHSRWDAPGINFMTSLQVRF